MGSVIPPTVPSVYFDTNCFIYRFEGIEPFWTLLQPVFEAATAGAMAIITSELTLLECLVKPRRMGDAPLERMLRDALANSREVRLLPISREVIDRAIDCRALHSIRTPDAIHAATALAHGCSSFYTNDAGFARVAGLNVKLLS